VATHSAASRAAGLARRGAAAALVFWSALAHGAGVEPRAFDSPEQESRYRGLIAELRCLVCQNQSLAESDADLAKDLREQTYQMVREGRSNEEVVDFMVGRYGDFVLYRPPVRTTTALLWFGPMLLVATGALIVVWQIRRRARLRADGALSPEEERRARELLTSAQDKS
jgi:cytochrome c-type biogenesis protein CcmH